MKSLFIFFIFLFTFLSSSTATNYLYPDTIRNFGNLPPSFPGGVDSFHRFLDNTVEIKSEFQRYFKLEVSFYITRDGMVKDFVILRSSSYPELDSAIVLAFINSPAWYPAYNMNIPIEYFMKIPLFYDAKNSSFFNLNIFFGSQFENGVPINEISKAWLDQEETRIYCVFNSLFPDNYKIRLEIFMNEKRLDKKEFTFNIGLGDTLYFSNFILAHRPPGIWKFKVYLDDVLIGEKELRVFNVFYEGTSNDYFALSFGAQVWNYQFAELNILVLTEMDEIKAGGALVIGTEYEFFQKMHVYKLGLILNLAYITAGGNLKLFTDYKGNNSFGLQPEIGLGSRRLTFNYGYNFQFVKDFPNINRHFFSIRYILPFYKAIEN